MTHISITICHANAYGTCEVDSNNSSFLLGWYPAAPEPGAKNSMRFIEKFLIWKLRFERLPERVALMLLPRAWPKSDPRWSRRRWRSVT